MFRLKRRKKSILRTEYYHYRFPQSKIPGIFINDEAPAFSGWTKEKFGGFNHLFYEKVFELILRLKGKLSLAGHVGKCFL